MRSSLFLFLFVLLSGTAVGQTFYPSDSVFSVGDVYTTRNIHWELGKGDITESSLPTLDSIHAFLEAHPDVRIEVTVHKDGRYYKVQHLFSTNLIRVRTESIVTYLQYKGIDEERIESTMEKRLLISDLQIDRMETNAEKEAAHAYNRRVEFKIISVSD